MYSLWFEKPGVSIPHNSSLFFVDAPSYVVPHACCVISAKPAALVDCKFEHDWIPDSLSISATESSCSQGYSYPFTSNKWEIWPGFFCSCSFICFSFEKYFLSTYSVPVMRLSQATCLGSSLNRTEFLSSWSWHSKEDSWVTNKQVNKQICTVSDGVRAKEMGLSRQGHGGSLVLQVNLWTRMNREKLQWWMTGSTQEGAGAEPGRYMGRGPYGLWLLLWVRLTRAEEWN